MRCGLHMYHVMYSTTQKGGSTEPPAYGPVSCNCSYTIYTIHALVIWEGGGGGGGARRILKLLQNSEDRPLRDLLNSPHSSPSLDPRPSDLCILMEG